MLPIAILFDGGPEPLSMLVERQSPYIAAPRNGTTRNFKFVRALGAGDAVLIYKDERLKLDPKAFDELANQEADKYLHPEKYAALQGELQIGN